MTEKDRSGWEIRKTRCGRGHTVDFITKWMHEGISIRVNKAAGTVYVSGWYDGMVGIEGGELTLIDLLRQFPPDVVSHVTRKLAAERRKQK